MRQKSDGRTDVEVLPIVPIVPVVDVPVVEVVGVSVVVIGGGVAYVEAL
jgi:hypothetical protein